MVKEMYEGICNKNLAKAKDKKKDHGKLTYEKNVLKGKICRGERSEGIEEGDSSEDDVKGGMFFCLI